MGAVQLIVIGFELSEGFPELIRREIDSLHGHGLFRIIDVLAIVKAPDGTIARLDDAQLSIGEQSVAWRILSTLADLVTVDATLGDDGSERAALTLAQRDFGFDKQDIKEIVDDLAPGSGALLLLIEHTWLGMLKEVVPAGGRLIAHGFLTPEVLEPVDGDLRVVIEAEAAIDLANALAGAALLDTLETVAGIELEAAGAGVEAHAAGDYASVLKISAGVAALKALIVAGLIDEGFAGEAVEVLVASGLFPSASAEQAAQLATQRAHEMEAAISVIETGAERTHEE